ncbi:MAG TPA: TAXI family TRAP transporter solute-binding subunit [Verrucomicrobiae bacterium]|nr:TAXI family TRAP transporter solute-binding subunit [Verrucomicrobiae bacterium]
MTRITSRLAFVFVLAILLFAGRAQTPQPASSPVVSATIAEKKPVFAGACKACPWGILAKVTADALRFYGYQTTICWVCWSSFGPREMGDKTKPVVPPGALDDPQYVEPPPDLVPDISATSESNLIDAWNGTGPYASDHKPRRNYRVIAVIRTSTYMLAAASRKSGITNLRQIKDRVAPTWITGNNAIIFDYYGIKPEDLRAKGGGIMPSNASREKRASADVFIGTGLLANTPEQRSWYEASQLNDLVFLDFEEPLIARLAREPGYQRATVPLALLRGVDRPIPTVMRPNHFIYVRDEAPDSFAYDVAKALDEHRDLFQVQLEPWYYDPQTVAVSKVIPMHPGAMRYYRERGYIK